MTYRLVSSVSIGLGLLVGVILHTTAHAQSQTIPPPPQPPASAAQDSARILALQDSVRMRQLADSIAAADTLRAPLPRFALPDVDNGDYVWSGDAILATGASTLADLLGRIPGVSAFRTGNVLTASSVAVSGCFNCLRIYLDGVELPAVNSRTGGVFDLAEIALWPLEEIRVSRGALELRVYLTSWSVTRTIPFTRVDIGTGSDESSLFGAFFGRRFKRGEILQLSGQQRAMNSRTGSGSGDRGSMVARVGKVTEHWGVDAYASRVTLFRDAQTRLGGLADAAAFEGSRTDAYVRARVGDPGRGKWLQLSAASINVSEKTPGAATPPPVEGEPAPPAADTSRTESQYLVAGGTTLGAFELGATARLRSLDGVRSNQLQLSASTSIALASLTALARRDTRDSTQLIELNATLAPFTSVRVAGSVAYVAPMSGTASDGRLHAHASAGVRLGDAWFHGGVLLRDSLSLTAPRSLDTAFVRTDEGSALGTYVRLNGRLWRSLFADVDVVRWNNDGWYRPQLETRARVYVETALLQHFPNNTFNFHLGVTLENRGDTRFPTGADVSSLAASHSQISALLEIRILSAVVYFQNRNIRGIEMSEVPGYSLPRRLNSYGVRWIFWN